MTGSNRSFGLLLCALCVIAGSLRYRAQGRVSIVWVALAAILLAIAIVVPRVLLPAKRLWLRFATVVEVAVSPVAVSFIHVVAVTSVGSLIRLFGKDLLSLRRDPAAASYWIQRDRGRASPESLKDQF